MDARRLRFGVMLAVALGVVGLSLALGLSDGGEQAGALPATTPTSATTATSATTSATRATATPANPLTCTATTLGGARTANAQLAADCDTLLSMETALVGTGLLAWSLNWAPGTEITRWNGVTVGGTPKRVTRLRLHGRRLTGVIPTQVGNLTALTELNLSWNRLTGTIPTELGSLTKLRTLALSGNSLTGCVPNALWSVATKDLARLWLSSCTRPTGIQYGQTVGEGTYYFADYYGPSSDFVIYIGTGRQIKWKETIEVEASSSGSPALFHVLVDVATGSEIVYEAYTGREIHRSVKSASTSGQSGHDTSTVTAFFDDITNTARMESIP